jgi:hypothetical protein
LVCVVQVPVKRTLEWVCSIFVVVVTTGVGVGDGVAVGAAVGRGVYVGTAVGSGVEVGPPPRISNESAHTSAPLAAAFFVPSTRTVKVCAPAGSPLAV